MSWISRLLLLLSSAAVCLASSSPKYLYLSDYCDKTLTVKRSVILKSSIFQDNDCVVSLQTTSTGNNLVAHFNTYRQASSPAALANFISGDCSSEYIQLLDDGGNKMMPRNGYCKSVRPTDHYELGPSGKFKYHSVLFKYITFELLVTEMYKKSTKDEECPAGQFDCDWHQYCVDEDLKCNGYNDCGNDDDENDGCGLSKVIIIGIVVGVIAAIALIIGIGFGVVKAMKH